MTGSGSDEVRRAWEWVRGRPAEDREGALRVLAPAVAAEVRRLLAVESSSFLGGADPAATLGRTDPKTACAGQRIGPYELVREIGFGGMGVVFEAWQSRPRRRVALKLVHSSVLTSESAVRFEREAQVLAQIRHRGVVPLFDAGRTDDGIPYLVMEFVEGEKLLAYADARRLSIRERVAAVLEVCEAVGHVHDAGIVHRDLTPANVLVGEDGSGSGGARRARPRVLDFGLAKILDERATRQEGRTRAHLHLGTLGYASPEQRRDARMAGKSADVYALGVILHELLTGQRPFPDEPGESAWAPPPPPPRPSARRMGIDADLDCIVLKAIQWEPERRYVDANALAADLQRHLEGRPVLARAPSAVYRASRFLRRHRNVASALGVGLILGGATVYGTRGVSPAREQIAAAAREGVVAATSPPAAPLVAAASLAGGVLFPWPGDGPSPELRHEVFGDAERPEFRKSIDRSEGRDRLRVDLEKRGGMLVDVGVYLGTIDVPPAGGPLALRLTARLGRPSGDGFERPAFGFLIRVGAQRYVTTLQSTPSSGFEDVGRTFRLEELEPYGPAADDLPGPLTLRSDGASIEAGLLVRLRTQASHRAAALLVEELTVEVVPGP